MKLSLVVMTAGKSKGQAVPVNLPQFIIGRDPQCNLRPASAAISKRHCALLVKDGKISVRDFDSTNGTFVNNVQIKGEVALKHDDVLKIGPLEFKVVVEAKPAGAKPTPAPAKVGSDDDSVAAMLLSLQEDNKLAGDESTSAEGASVPAGSTVMDLAALPPAAPTVAANGAAAETPKPEATKAPPKKEAKNDPAHLAAKAILEKYSRRTRG
jgi:pSer/pThr/pTyr-binding forkhead associated (FHA) protein